MKKLSRISLLATTFAVVIALGAGTPAMAKDGGGSQGGAARRSRAAQRPVAGRSAIRCRPRRAR